MMSKKVQAQRQTQKSHNKRKSSSLQDNDMVINNVANY